MRFMLIIGGWLAVAIFLLAVTACGTYPTSEGAHSTGAEIPENE